MTTTTAVTKYKVARTDTDGVTFAPGHRFVSWANLQSAARQKDKELAEYYARLLTEARRAEQKRLISEDWKQYGYPLRTGFGQQYSGQAVMRAWEIRRVHKQNKDVRVAYIITLDRCDGRVTRGTSPELTNFDACIEWLSEHYGGWHDELGDERTAEVWFRS